jgi:hypothetical protein
MDLSEFNTQSFIVKIWLEEPAGKGGPAVWRGHITHVPSGERQYLEDLDKIKGFMLPYLQAMGVRQVRWPKARHWLKQCRRYLVRQH